MYRGFLSMAQLLGAGVIVANPARRKPRSDRGAATHAGGSERVMARVAASLRFGRILSIWLIGGRKPTCRRDFILSLNSCGREGPLSISDHGPRGCSTCDHHMR